MLIIQKGSKLDTMQVATQEMLNGIVFAWNAMMEVISALHCQGTKYGLIMVTLSSENRGDISVTQKHQWSNQIFMIPKLCSIFGGTRWV